MARAMLRPLSSALSPRPMQLSVSLQGAMAAVRVPRGYNVNAERPDPASE